MITNLLKKLFGTRNERLIASYQRIVDKINQLEPSLEVLSDDELKAKTNVFKQRLKAGELLDDLLPEAFAVVREASKRTLGLRHFDVQLIGGMVLHYGNIAEMRMGEGKTLAGTLPCYLNALTEKGVHVVTVNDYLAKRDAEWMQPIYEFLGLTVGVNLTTMHHEEKKIAYAADITYGTNNEFGFDYLRDNMVYDLSQRVQRPLNYAIVDEVDSILIDEARTPLIISGQVDESSELYHTLNQLIPHLEAQIGEPDPTGEKEPEKPGDYYVDEKNRQAYLTDMGHEKIEALLNKEGLLKEGDSLYSPQNITLMHYVNACLRAHVLFQRDVHYIVRDNQVIIVDEHTGRLMNGRRWSDGLHQAVEAKENVAVQLENQTLATITFQNYFRIYEKLAGMTGTADTEAYEFQNIYGLEVVVIPTNRPMIREDLDDQIFLTAEEKYKAIIKEIRAAHEKGQPVLVGTASIENSELVSQLLTQAEIKHQVLNAKQHEREANIIVEAGRPGTVTIATNMAGRGTDISLGGNFEAELAELKNPSEADVKRLHADWEKRHQQVLNAGGLLVLATERHESRRIDNQLRGRAGRQGDPGRSCFYLSLEDNLLRIFAADRMANLMRKLGVKEGDVIEHLWVTKAIENAQRRVEGINFDVRKNLLEYDDVANDQRKVIYAQRFDLLTSDSIANSIVAMREEVVEDMVHLFIPPMSLEEEWDVYGLEKQLRKDFGLKIPVSEWLEQDETLNEEELPNRIFQVIQEAVDQKEAAYGNDAMRQLEKNIMLQFLDHHWKDHLAAMDHMRRGIHLRGYAQKNPTQEYKRESFNMFKSMLASLKYDIISTLSRAELRNDEEISEMQQAPQMTLTYHHEETSAMPLAEEDAGVMVDSPQIMTHDGEKVGRNDPCPCGSGKKYKICHGKLM